MSLPTTNGTSTDAPVPPEILALIAAVVNANYGEGTRVRSVRLAPPEGESDLFFQPWAMEGRRQIYSSHKVR